MRVDTLAGNTAIDIPLNNVSGDPWKCLSYSIHGAFDSQRVMHVSIHGALEYHSPMHWQRIV